MSKVVGTTNIVHVSVSGVLILDSVPINLAGVGDSQLIEAINRAQSAVRADKDREGHLTLTSDSPITIDGDASVLLALGLSAGTF